MKFDITKEICLGISHCGAVTTEGSGIIELEDNEVSVLISLIKEKKTSDVDELGIEESHPDLYEKLHQAYHDIAYRAEELHWLWEGYYNDCFDYDRDELKSYCKDYCGFIFEYDEDYYTDEDGEIDKDSLEYDEDIAFAKWLDDYVASLDEDEACDFFYEQMNADLNLDDVSYKVEIPEEIIKMANNA